MTLFKYFIVRSVVLAGISSVFFSSSNAGGNVGLLSTLMTRGVLTCALPRHLLKKRLADFYPDDCLTSSPVFGHTYQWSGKDNTNSL